MNFSQEFTLLIALTLTGSLIYRNPFLTRKKVFRLTLHQILYLILFPSIFVVMINSYAIYLTGLPKVSHQFLTDSIAQNILVLAFLFTFGGKSIHTVTKSLIDRGLKSNTEAGRLNNFLHLSFSHNLIICGIMLIMTAIVILELNHIPTYQYNRAITPISRGIIMGFGFIIAMSHYIRSNLSDNYEGRRWNDLRFTFIFSWFSFIIISIALVYSDLNLNQSQLAFPVLASLAVVNTFTLILLIRKLLNRNKNLNHLK